LLIVVALGKLFDIVGMFLTPEQPPGTYSTPIICQGLLCLAVLFLIPTISAAMLHQLAVNTGPWAVSVFYTMLLITILFVFRGIIARYTAWRESIQDKPWRMRFLLTKLLPSAVIFGYVVLIMVAN
jgi:membrane protein YdbS with pleckstrin-like domain